MTDDIAPRAFATDDVSSGAIEDGADRAPPLRVTVTLEGHGAGTGSTEERVLVILERAQGFGRLTNMPRRLPVGCRRGGCGICRVRVTAGSYRTTAMSRTHVSPDEEAEGVVLACAIYPRSDLSLRLEPVRLEKNGRTAEKSQGGE